MELQFTYPALQLRQFLSSLDVNLSKRKVKTVFYPSSDNWNDCSTLKFREEVFVPKQVNKRPLTYAVV
jgi:hypothetical protein